MLRLQCPFSLAISLLLHSSPLYMLSMATVLTMVQSSTSICKMSLNTEEQCIILYVSVQAI